MDEIKLWRIDDEGSVSSLRGMARLDNELALEELLVAHPELLEPELELVGRQLQAAGGWLDLLAVDSAGRLVIYELKRGILGRDAVTQLLDYASALSEMELDDLATHIASRSGQGGIKQIPDFKEWYSAKFSDLDSVRPARMVLVGLGIDSTARRIARLLGDYGLEVEVITFYGFRDGGSKLLARQVEIKRDEPTAVRKRSMPIAQRREALQDWLSESGLADRFDAVCETLRDRLPTVFENPTRYGISFQLDVTGKTGVRGPRPFFGVFAGYSKPDGIEISLGTWVTDFHGEAVAQLGEKVSLSDWAHGGKVLAVESNDEWGRVKATFSDFVTTVVEEWRKYRKSPMAR